MIATFVFTFTNINLAQEEPLRFVGLENYQTLLGDAQAWESLGVTFRFAALALPVAIVLPFVVALAAQQPRTCAGSGVVPDPVLPAVRRCRSSSGVLDLAAGCSTSRPAGSTSSSRFIGVQNPPDWLQDPTLDLPGAGDHRHLGHRRRDHRQPRRPARASRPSCTTPPGSTAPAAWASLRHVTHPDDVAGHLLHARPRRRRGAPVLPRPARPQERHRRAGRLDAASSTSTCTRLLHLPEHVLRRDAGLAPVRRSRWSITLVLFRTSRRWVYYAGER